jgi:hypothetical protein
MNRRLRLTPPKVTLATISGIRILPISVPSGSKQCTPSAVLVQTRPSRVDAKAVERSGGADREHLATLDAFAVGRHGEAADMARRAGVGDVEQFLVGREGQPIRANHVVDDSRDIAGFRIDAVSMTTVDLGGCAIALVVAVDAVGRIGEPDRIVRLDDGVVGRVEALALPLVGEDRDRSVDLGSRDAAHQVLAGDEPSLVVDSVAV